MINEIYFSIKNDSLERNDKKIQDLSYVNRLYLSSVPGQKGNYLLGVSKKNSDVISDHNGRDKLNIRIGSVLSDFNKEPNLVSVMALERYSDRFLIKNIFSDLKETSDGLCYNRSYGGYHVSKHSPENIYEKEKTLKNNVKPLSSKITRIAISGQIKPFNESYGQFHKQYIVIEFCGAHNSASKYVELIKEKIDKKNKVLGVSTFSLIGKNIKQTIKS